MSLDRLLGAWDLTMRHSAMSEPVGGRQHYERVLDGAFVQLIWTYDHADFPDAVAMLSPDRLHYFDVRGVVRVFDLTLEDDGFQLIRLDPQFAQRFTSRFEGPDAMEMYGEASDDGGATWQHDFTLTLRRIS